MRPSRARNPSGGLNKSCAVSRCALFTALICLAQPAFARPLVTSSEENVVRLCIAREGTPQRIVATCDAALAEAGLTTAQRVDLTIARADGHLWLENHDAAETGYRDAASADPQSPDAWNGLGWALRETGGDRAAFDAFETSLAVEVSIQGLGGKAATGRGAGLLSGEEARVLLRAALAIDPEYAWALREIGWSLLDDDRPDDAETVFGEALALDALDLNARYGLGRAVLSSGKAERALEHFNGVLAEDPEFFAARVYRIITLRDLDRNAQALRESDRLIETFPDRSSGYVERALSLQSLQRRTEAIETFARAEQVLGDDNSILYWYADALAADRQYKQALDVIDRALGLSGANHSDHLLKSYIALELKDYALVRSAAEASLQTGVEDPWAHYYIAISMVHSGQTDEGLTRFARAMETGLPDDRVGAFARELISAGKYVEAAQLRLRY